MNEARTQAAGRLAPGDIAHAAALAVAALLSYWLITAGATALIGGPPDKLGGMWAGISAIFVFRDTVAASLAAGRSRLIATAVSCVLCLAYLLVLPFTALGMAALVAAGVLFATLLGRREDGTTTGITILVVMVVADVTGPPVWRQPFLRLLDTAVGIAVGVGCQWIAWRVSARLARNPSPPARR